MYVDRDKDGKITGAYARPQREGQEQAADDAEELVAFLNPISTENEEEEKIQTKMRIMAIEALKAEGELPLDFEA